MAQVFICQQYSFNFVEVNRYFKFELEFYFDLRPCTIRSRPHDAVWFSCERVFNII